jgi:hypothetical protein
VVKFLLFFPIDKRSEGTYAYKTALQMPKETYMTERAELLKEIDNLPPKYFGEVLDFVGYLRQKDINENDDETDAYKAMAADTEREQEAREWCSAN